MGIRYSFIDSTVYGTDDINDITRSLTGAGVAPFVSKDSYNATDLNVLTSALVESGVQLDGCKCTVYNAGTADMMIAVAQGIIFFQSGVRLEVDEAGYNIAVIPNQAGYIYAYYRPSLQKVDILFGTDLPSDGEYVQLAAISAAGVLSDKRKFARSKVATLGRNAIVKCNFTPVVRNVSDKLRGSNEPDTVYYYMVGAAEGIDINSFNYVIVEAIGTTNLYNLTTQTGVIGVHPGWSAPSTGGSYIGAYGSVNYNVRMVDDILCIVERSGAKTPGAHFDVSEFTAEFI